MLEFPLINDTSRKIIHIDMDAFFAQVEMRDDPSLKDKPVIIGNDPRKTGGRGVVSTCNYEARKYGVHSAMSSKEAYERCPNAVFISGNYSHYREVGMQIREIFKCYTDLVEPMSIDEAYLDVSYNKFIAKLASDFQKPAGLTVVLPEEAQEFLKKLPIAKFHGVGKKSVERLHDMDIYTGADLLKISEITLIDRFGRFGFDLFRKARGISNSPVKPNRVRKSIGSERTYGKLLYNEDDIKAELTKNAKRVAESAQKAKKVGRIIVIKVRYSDFSTLTKRMTLDKSTQDFDTIDRISHSIFDQLEENSSGVRLLGVTLTGLEDQEGRQLDLDDLA